MKVTFAKTGLRRYTVTVDRERWPRVATRAPGYDDHLPHDLLHFVAEAEWRLDGAVFGQLAAGGDAGSFLPTDPARVNRAVRDRKRRRRLAPKPKGRRSEVLTYILGTAWQARHGRAALPDTWDEKLAAARVDPVRLERVLDRLDELSERWQELRVGDGLTLEWPRPESRRRRPVR
jgi:hypothetical protein